MNDETEDTYDANGEVTRAESGRRIREARIAAGWPSAYRAAIACGVPLSQYQDYEKGRSIPFWSKLLRIAGRLSLDPEILFPELYAQTKDEA